MSIRILRHNATLAALLCCLVGASLGCGEGQEPSPQPVVHFDALERDVYSPTTIADPGTGASKEDLARFEIIFQTVERNAERLLRQSAIDGRLESIEQAYVAAGRYLDLVAIYRRDVEKYGVAKGPAATRLTWAMVRLGQEREAKDLLDRLLSARPADPDAWFLLGAYWVKYAQSDPAAAKRVILGWSKVTELDPNYVGFEGINAPTLTREVTRVRQTIQLTPGELEVLEATYTAPREEELPKDEVVEDGATPPEGAPPEVEEVVESVPGAPDAAAPEEVLAPEESPTRDEVAELEADDGDGIQPAERVPNEVDDPTEDASPAVQPEPLAVMLGRSRLTMAQEDTAQAKRLFRRALRTHTGGTLKGALSARPPIEARVILEMVRLAHELEVESTGAEQVLRDLAARKEITPRTLMSMATFALRPLNAPDLAIQLLERLEREDPAFAKKVDAAALLDQAKSQ